MLLTVAVAAGLRVHERDSRRELRRVADRPRDRRRGVPASLFALLNPFALLNLDEARRQITGQSAQADTAKLGQDDTCGWLYYLGTLTWGFGWLPLLAAVARRRARAAARLAARAAARRVPGLLLPLHGRAGPLLRPLAAARSTRRCACSPATPSVARDQRAGRAAALVAASPRWSARRACSRASTSTRVLGPRGHPRAGARLGPRQRPRRRASRGRAVHPGRLARRAGPARCGRSSGRTRPTRSACACATSTATASAATAG